jgi:hypothetical protein
VAFGGFGLGLDGLAGFLADHFGEFVADLDEMADNALEIGHVFPDLDSCGLLRFVSKIGRGRLRFHLSKMPGLSDRVKRFLTFLLT